MGRLSTGDQHSSLTLMSSRSVSVQTPSESLLTEVLLRWMKPGCLQQGPLVPFYRWRWSHPAGQSHWVWGPGVDVGVLLPRSACLARGRTPAPQVFPLRRGTGARELGGVRPAAASLRTQRRLKASGLQAEHQEEGE